MSLNQQFFRKEAREMMWYWVAAAAVLLLGVYQIITDPGRRIVGEFNALVFSLLWFAGYTLVHAVATYPFTSEFANNTMARLLAQPVKRTEIWKRKILLIATSLSVLALLQLLSLWLLDRSSVATGHPSPVLHQILLISIVSAFFSGPLMALSLRQGLTSLLASMITPFAFLLFGALFSVGWGALFGFRPAEEGPTIWHVPVMWWILGAVCCIFAHLAARRAFLRLEV